MGEAKALEKKVDRLEEIMDAACLSGYEDGDGS